MYEDAKKLIKKKHYASMSEFIRHMLRKELHPELTENGFTPEFEEQVLKAAAEPMGDDIVLKTDEDFKNYFLNLKKPTKKH